MKEIYFDNASTALPVYSDTDDRFGNPSTTHALGIRAYNELNQAKKDLCKVLGCEKDELVFTSGGTESNNLAIIGYAIKHRRNNVRFYSLPWAHPSVTQTMKHVEALGFGNCHAGSGFTLSILNSPSTTAWASTIPTDFAEGINFISLPQICHETGDRYDVAEISHAIKKQNPKNIIHIDGVQGFCKEKINLKNIDLYSFSGHKIHAPSGTGGLYVKKGVKLSALLYGGGQEMGLRAGTENTNGVADLCRAAKRLYENKDLIHHEVSDVKAELQRLTDELEFVYVNSTRETSPYILNMSFSGVKGEVLVNMLSEKGIYVSTGAACKTSKKEVPALVLMGFSKERADSAIRFGFSHANTAHEAKHVRSAIVECVKMLRNLRR